MSHVITETATNAVFGTGLTVPDNGDDFTASCAVALAAVQQLADREQWLKGWQVTTPRYRVALDGKTNTSARFAEATAAVHSWTQTSVASVGQLDFRVGGPLPVGRKITAVTATINNGSTANVAIGTMPVVQLNKSKQLAAGGGSITTVATTSDPTAVLATYQALHDFGPTGLTEVIDQDYEYFVTFKGETGANSTTGLTLYRIFLTLGY